MASGSGDENPIDWFSIFTNSVGFVWGGIFGGITGYFGNWLWDKFKPRKKQGHLDTSTDETGTYFQGKLTADNKEQILKTLRATATPTSSTTRGAASGTQASSSAGSATSSTR
ncbi:hypothetical protein [Vibrio parahaemolyticus]|uniref:hypothetical protein n=1 Tax=Vibrio parahaemolyticus TaxID=670 RepID=UPI0004A474EF|nr:hypothetical protein [Vibrio parahaemolyticus]MBE5196220.1 hypothetical protein [Vibrio parahaemolyticus]TOE28251.1 hypothetical protein CGJ46_24200 [Vibrio parahaemolyticus]